jgi:solute carrier family 35 protein E3
MGDLRLLLSLAINVISSVGVIFINKRMVFMQADFPFGSTLTVIHFLVTFLGCLAFAHFRFFSVKKLQIKSVLSISMAFCGYVVFNNLSLLTNTVPIYQLSKIVCTPLIVAVEYLIYKKREPLPVLLSLIPVCLGICITVYSDSSVNLVGSFWAVLAIVANSFYTIWGKTKQVELGVSPMQILTYQAPISVVILAVTVPLLGLDSMPDLMAYKMNVYALWAIGISCIFAFGVNFSFFLFVGQTSPLTMNVVGYLKTCLVFVGGFVFFDTTLSHQQGIGIVVAMAGLAAYTKAKMDQAKAAEGIRQAA